MIHFFDTEIAEAYGVNCAVILNHIYYWCLKNEADNINLKDGRYWTYSSIKALCKLFPYLTRDSIQYAIRKLVDAGMILEGEFNENKMDRTKWYSITEKSELHFGKKAEAFRNIPKCGDNYIYIESHKNNKNNNKTYGDSENSSSPTDTSSRPSDGQSLDSFFNDIWKLYPKKKGKGSVSVTQKKKLQRIGYDELSRCIERYKSYINDNDIGIQYVMHGSTFFNSGYVDYLDENYNEPMPVRSRQGNGGRE